MKNITLCYVVGGKAVHYENMHRSIASLRDHGLDCKILIHEFGDTLKSNNEYDVVNIPDVIDFSKKWSSRQEARHNVGYLIWRQKYVVAQDVKTEYGMYVDSDMVMATNTLQDITRELEDGIGVVRHFWVPSIGYYRGRCTPTNVSKEFFEIKNKTGVEDHDPYFAGGTFLFANNEKNRKVFKRILEWYSMFPTPEDFITDEFFLAAAIKEYKEKGGKVLDLGGGFNHCSMGDEHMPLICHEGDLYGRNPYEQNWVPVTMLHCDVALRDPSEQYTGELKKIVRKKFYMEEQ